MWEIIGGIVAAFILTSIGIWFTSVLTDPLCARCGNGRGKWMMRFQISHTGCEGRVCYRCLDELTRGGLQEGKVKKGGVNGPPTRPRPPTPPKGQG